ncbi:MAG: CPBP family intramembrane glutamic endopeptidase, partial [Bacteroidales bacterium]
RLVPVRANASWYLVAIFLLPLAGILINILKGDPVKIMELPGREVLTLLLAILISGPLGEELGWRGFALPLMLKRQSAISAALLLGLIWGLWHLPSFFMSGLPQVELQIPVFIIAALSLSVIVTWIFVNTNYNLFLTFLFHYTLNFTYTLVGSAFIYMTMVQVVIALLVLVIFGKELKFRRN